jgi:hypothetical protein
VVLAQPAVLLGHREPQEAVLAEQLQVAARVRQRVVGDLGVRPDLLLAQLDEKVAQLELALGQEPVWVPVGSQPEVGLAAPALLGHCSPPGSLR